MVVHLETAAKGAESFYKNGWTVDDMGKKVFRKESPEEAREMDDIMIQCWKNHHKHFIVDNVSYNSFDKKLDAVDSYVFCDLRDEFRTPPKFYEIPVTKVRELQECGIIKRGAMTTNQFFKTFPYEEYALRN